MLAGFHDLGVGVGLRPPHYSEFFQSPPSSVSWVEVISENFMDWQHQSILAPMHCLKRVRQHLPVVLHGVSLSIGSCEPLDLSYLASLKKLVHEIEPAWLSDHLCWTGIGGENLHDLLPVPYTEESLKLVVEKIEQVQDFLGRRILLENPSTYLQFEQDEMTEWDFIRQMAQKADCGILLDINNVYVNSINHNFDPLLYLKSMPKERVCQLHLAGHSDNGDHHLDTHDAPVCQEVWDLYRFCLSYFGNLSVMIERDEKIPPWAELEREVKQLSKMREDEGAKRASFSVTEAL